MHAAKISASHHGRIRVLMIIGFATLITLGFAVSLNSPARREELADPPHFIQDFVNQILGQMIVDRPPVEADRARLRELFTKACDLPTIGRFALGYYWNLASPEDRERFQQLFEANLIDASARRFQRYSGAHVIVTDQRPDGQSDAIVVSQIAGEQIGSIVLKWRVRQELSGLKVVLSGS